MIIKHLSSYGLYIYAVVLMISFLGLSPIYILDEAKFAEAAREMYVSGNYIAPYFNGNLFVDKPPLQYFMSVLGFKIFGVNAFGARFFSAIFGLLTLVITLRFCNDFWNKKTSQYVGVVFLSSFFLLQQFQLATPDPYLIFFCTAALFSFYRFHVYQRKLDLFFFYLLLGFGVLAKGPIAIALPGVSVGFFILLSGQIKKTFNYYPVLGLCLTLIIASPWFWMVHQQTDGAWTEGFFMVHNFSRFSGAMEGHGGVFLITWGYVLLGLLPFSFFLPQTLILAYKKRMQPHILFSTIVSAVFIIFFSISSTKLPNYTMPCYPFLILLMADYFYTQKDQGQAKWTIINTLLIALISILLCFLPLLLVNEVAAFDKTPNISWWLVPTAIGSLIACYWHIKQRFNNWFFVMGSSWNLLFIILFVIIYPTLNSYNPVSQVTEKIGKDRTFIVYKRMDPAFPFNYQRTFDVFNTPKAVKAHLNANPNTYLMTNIRDSKDLDTIANLELKMQQKSPFEYHITKVYQLKKE